MGRTHAESRERMQRIALDCLRGMPLEAVIAKHHTGRTTVDLACKKYGIKPRLAATVGRKTAHVFNSGIMIPEVLDLLTRLIDSEPAGRFTRIDVRNLLGLATRLQQRIDVEENRIKKGLNNEIANSQRGD